MKITLLGATGRTGRLVLASTANSGHEITTLVRNRADLPGEAYAVHEGDVRSSDSLAEALAGSEAVISAVGARGREKNLHAERAQNTISAMKEVAVSRFVGIGVGGLDLPGDKKGPRDKAIGKLARARARARALAGAATRDRMHEWEAWQHSGLN